MALFAVLIAMAIAPGAEAPACDAKTQAGQPGPAITVAAARPMPVWQPRFYDFNVWTERKRIEKLRYMHCNPVKRGLVAEPEQWRWSSFRYYKYPRSDWSGSTTARLCGCG